MTTQSGNRNRAIAAVATLLLHGVLAAVLLTLFLRYDGSAEASRVWPPVDSSEILFGGEYVMLGDAPDADATPDSPAELPATPEPEAETPVQEPLVTTATSPAPEAIKTVTPPKTTEKPAPARPSAAETERKETSTKINNRVKFGNADATPGSPGGNSATGAVSGIAASGLGNRSAVDLPRPARSPMGKVVVTVKVNRDGRVTSASFLSGEGAAGADETTRRRCIKAARRARFSASAEAPVSQTGTLTYTFK